MAKFWIDTPRYIRQVGQDDPQYVNASPRHPALIEVPDDSPVDAGMRPFDQPAERARPHYAERNAVMGKLPPQPASASSSGKRLADR